MKRTGKLLRSAICLGDEETVNALRYCRDNVLLRLTSPRRLSWRNLALYVFAQAAVFFGALSAIFTFSPYFNILYYGTITKDSSKLALLNIPITATVLIICACIFWALAFRGRSSCQTRRKLHTQIYAALLLHVFVVAVVTFFLKRPDFENLSIRLHIFNAFYPLRDFLVWAVFIILFVPLTAFVYYLALTYRPLKKNIDELKLLPLTESEWILGVSVYPAIGSFIVLLPVIIAAQYLSNMYLYDPVDMGSDFQWNYLLWAHGKWLAGALESSWAFIVHAICCGLAAELWITRLREGRWKFFRYLKSYIYWAIVSLFWLALILSCVTIMFTNTTQVFTHFLPVVL